jgi:hypothetical protein
MNSTPDVSRAIAIALHPAAIGRIGVASGATYLESHNLRLLETSPAPSRAFSF